MLRGIRWQFAALVLSIIIFSISITFRLINQPEPAPPPTQLALTATPTTAAQTATSPAATSMPDAQVTQLEVQPTADPVLTFREGLVGTVTRFNPLLAVANTAEADINALIFEGLTRINAFGEPTGALAQEWVVSRDGLEYVFVLRPDVLWQDGTPFTADDVIYTLSLLSDPAYPDATIRAFWQTVEIQKLDANLVRFRLAQPLSSFPTRLTIGLLPEHAWRGTSAADLAAHPLNLQPIGTGPYQLEALRSSDAQTITSVDLRAAPTFQARGGSYAIQRMRFQIYPSFDAARLAFQNAQIDGIATQTMAQRFALTQLNESDLYTEIAPRLGVVLFNWGSAEDPSPFADQRIRRGLQLGLNREGPVQRFLAGEAILADSPILGTSWAHAPSITWPAPNDALARDLLQRLNDFNNIGDEAEATAEPDQELTTYRFLVADIPELLGIAQEIAAQWTQYGINIEIDNVMPEVHQQRLADGDFDIALAELPLDADPDSYAYWHVSQYPDGANYGGMADDRVSELLERARREPNGLNRVDLYYEFQRAFIDRAAAIPLYYPLFSYAVNNSVEGVQLGFLSQRSDRFRTLADWTRP